MHVTGITPALSDACHQTTLEALVYALENDIPVSFDVNYREQLWSPSDARAVFDEMLGYTSVFKVGQDEAETVWAEGLDPEGYARFFHRQGVKLVIVTRGSGGAVAFDGTSLISHPGYDVSVIDPIGAGDAFVAGFLWGILQEYTLSEFFALDQSSRKVVLRACLDIANVCGALTCTRNGDTAAMPTMDEVREFLATSI